MTQSIPTKFAEELAQYLDTNELQEFFSYCQRPLKKSIAINTYKISVDTFKELTAARGRTLTPNPFQSNPTSFYIDREDTSFALWKSFLHQAGFFYIQEMAASMPATLLDLTAGDIVLDIAAAPGWKTSQLATRLLSQSNPGFVIANDVSWPRLTTLAHNLNKGGCYNTALTKFNGFAFGKNLPEFFDHVLVDAPCSGEGTAFKSDDALLFRRKEEINKITWTQFQLLISAIKATKPWGTVIYSTCTINPYENEELLARVIDFFEGTVELETVDLHNTSSWIRPPNSDYAPINTDKVARFRPHREKTGGFFVSKLRKLASHEPTRREKHHKLLPQNQFKLDMSKQLQKTVAARLETTYGITIEHERHRFVATKENVYLTSPSFVDIQPQLHCEKVGIPVLKKERDGSFRPTHHLGNILWDRATRNIVILSDEQVQTYSEGNNIPLSDLETTLKRSEDYVLIKRQQRGMSVGKCTGDELKNKFGKW